MNSKYIILAGADIPNYDWLCGQITPDNFIICADSGLRHAHEINITPDIIIGDFDSVNSELLESYCNKSKIIHDNDQNSTDMMKALSLTDNSKPVEIYGAIGQRSDHDFSNYLILMNMDNPDIILLKSETEERRIIKSNYILHGNIGDIIGVFPLQEIHNMSFEGLKYPSDGLNQPFKFGWNGACNEMANTTANINIDSGCALITHSFIK